MKLIQPVFLLGSHKSGTSLVRSLLDGHPELVVFPSEVHFFQYGGYWVDYSLRRQRPKSFSTNERVALLKRFLVEENHCTDPYGASDMAGKYDESTFNEVIESAAPADIRELYEIYVEAVYRSYAQEDYPVARRLVEKSVENTEFAPLLRRTFPDSKFVHIVRNPYATLVSIRRARSQAGYPYMGTIALSLRNSYYNLLRNLEVLDNYLVVKYEDIVSEPDATIAAMMQFLGLSGDPCTLAPSLLGEPWGGNSTTNATFSGISTSRLDGWLGEISDFEIALTNQMLGPVINYLGYTPVAPRHSVMRQRFEPHKREHVAMYTKNRLFQWLIKSV